MTNRQLTRRNFGVALGASLAALATGAAHATSRRFLFVHAMGGWDPLCVFAPMFGASSIQMETDATPATVKNFKLVDSPNRPSVTPFFEKWGDQTLLINGLSTRSVNHETCQVVALTGGTSDGGVDWPTMLAAAEQARYYMPHLVLGGPAFPGDQAVYVSRAEGLVQPAVNGNILELVDTPFELPPSSARQTVDAYLANRAAALAGGGVALASTYQTAVTRAKALVDADVIDFPVVESLRDQGMNAIKAMSDNVARCATISAGFNWDTHADNSLQSENYESLFTDLGAILEQLRTTTTAEGKRLSDETTVVVLSEMGRTPAYNATQGRDHWPYTSALIIGSGITGNRTIGGYTDLYRGIGVDPKSGDLDESRNGVSTKSLGATLLALGNVDPGDYLTEPEVIQGVLQ